MITLNITSSPDSEILGEYLTFSNEIIVGRSTQCTLPIVDNLISDVHALIRLSKTVLIVKCTDENDYYFINGKKYLGEKKIDINDVLKIGNTEINITSFNFDPKSSPGDFKEYYKKTITKYPETTIVLEALEVEIQDLSEKI